MKHIDIKYTIFIKNIKLVKIDKTFNATHVLIQIIILKAVCLFLDFA